MSKTDWKWEYENLCKFATQYEEERDRLRLKIKDLEDDIQALTHEGRQGELEQTNVGLADEVRQARELMSHMAEVLTAVIEPGEEFWSLEQERLGNKAIVLPVLKKYKDSIFS